MNQISDTPEILELRPQFRRLAELFPRCWSYGYGPCFLPDGLTEFASADDPACRDADWMRAHLALSRHVVQTIRAELGWQYRWQSKQGGLLTYRWAEVERGQCAPATSSQAAWVSHGPSHRAAGPTTFTRCWGRWCWLWRPREAHFEPRPSV